MNSDIEDGLSLLREAEGILRSLVRRYPAAYTHHLATTLMNIANSLGDLDRAEDAESTCREALELVDALWQTQPEVYGRDLALVLNNLGALLREQGNLSEAEAVIRRSEQLDRELAQVSGNLHTPELAGTLNTLGLILRDLGRFDSAKTTFREAAERDPRNLRGRRARALMNLAGMLEDEGKLDEAIDAYGLALDAMEQVRGTIGHGEDRHDYSSPYLSVYQKLTRLLVVSGRFDEAWHWVERAKGRVLLERLASAEPSLDTDEKRDVYARWRAVSEAISAAQTQQGDSTFEWQSLARGPIGDVGWLEPVGGRRSTRSGPRFEDPDLDRLAGEERQLRERLLQLLDNDNSLIQLSTPTAAEMKATLCILTESNVTRRRPLLVEYARLGPDEYGISLVPLWQDGRHDTTVVSCKTILVDRDLRQQVVELAILTRNLGYIEMQERSNAVRTESPPAPLPETVVEGEAQAVRSRDLLILLLFRIRETFLRPWLDELVSLGLDPTELILVPNDLLHILPLHVAPIDDDGTLLFEKYPFVYLHNATLAQTLVRRRQWQGERRPLVLGPAGSDLEFAQREANDLAARWQLEDQPYSGDQMRVDVLRKHVGAISILHLATHSYFKSDQYLESGIHFSGKDLTLADLISDGTLHSPGLRLCYLSSCDSAISHYQPGDELEGLVWSLTYAGSRAVMATLWPVDDEAAYVMSRQFYDHWESGCMLAEAYAKAVWDLRSGLCGDRIASNPYYWAPFVLFGDGWGK